MIEKSDYLSKYVFWERGVTVSVRDSSKLSVEGKEKIKIYQKDEKPEYIFNVYYIPYINSNILNIGQLIKMGYMYI